MTGPGQAPDLAKIFPARLMSSASKPRQKESALPSGQERRPMWPKELLAHLKGRGVRAESIPLLSPEEVLAKSGGLDEKTLGRTLQCLFKITRDPALLRSRLALLVGQRSDSASDPLIWTYNLVSEMCESVPYTPSRTEESSENNEGFARFVLSHHRSQEHSVFRAMAAFVLSNIKLTDEQILLMVKSEIAGMLRRDKAEREGEGGEEEGLLSIFREARRGKSLPRDRDTLALKLKLVVQLAEKAGSVKAFDEVLDLYSALPKGFSDADLLRRLGCVVLRSYKSKEEVAGAQKRYLARMKKRCFEPHFIKLFVNRALRMEPCEERAGCLRDALEYAFTDRRIQGKSLCGTDIAAIPIGEMLSAIKEVPKTSINMPAVLPVVKAAVKRAAKSEREAEELPLLLEYLGGFEGRSVDGVRGHIRQILSELK